MSERRLSSGIEHETRVNKTNLVNREWRQLEKAVPVRIARHMTDCLRMSLSPPEEIPEGLLELLKRLNGVLTPPQLTTEKRLWCKGRE
jgi:hypothetical protein